MIPEELSRLFLTNSQLQKLIILNELEEGRANLSTLEIKLGVSKRKLKEIIYQLMEELSIEKYKSNCPLVLDKESIFICSDFEMKDYATMLNTCRERYLEESSLFQVLLLILEKRVFSVPLIADTLAYSESYVYKLLKKLKEFFQLMNIDIQLIKKNETLIRVKGSEMTIRMLHYLVVSVASKGNRWLLKTISESEILALQRYLNSERYKKLSPIGKKRVNYILGIFESALKNNCSIPIIDNQVKEIGEKINKEKEIGLYLKYLREKDLDIQIHKEVIYLSFFVCYFMQELRTDKEKIALGKSLLSLKNNKIVKCSITILEKVTEKYSMNESLYYELIYCLCNRIVVTHYFALYKFMPLNNVPPIRGKMEQFVEECVSNTLSSYKDKPSFSKMNYSLTQIIIGSLILSHPINQKIYIEFFYRPEYKSIITHAIKHNYHSDVLQITDNYQQADIIISDTYGYENKKYFYFKDVFDEKAWEQLGAYLNKIISNEVQVRN